MRLPLRFWLLTILALSLLASGCTGSLAGPTARATEDDPVAPDFTARGYGENVIQLAASRGKPIVLNFWASWCPPCQAEAPALERVWQTYRAQGVVFLGVNIQDNEVDGRNFLEKYGITYENVREGDEIARSYSVSGNPTTILIDRQGRIVERHTRTLTEEQLMEKIESLLD